MMQQIKNLIKNSVLGGLLVVLPAIILIAAFSWFFRIVTDFIQPLTAPVAKYINASDLVIDSVVILLILMTCFLVGNITSTRSGKWLHTQLDKVLSKLAPGYNLVRDITHQILSNDANSSFSHGDVALARLFGADIPTEVTGIITSRHSNGWLTLFVPTGPNPTSGMIYHLPPDQVKILPHIKVDEALRTIIACGAGSGELLTKQINNTHRPLND